MLGLGNALTRSINFGLLGEAAIFNNSPAVGSRQYGGVVLGVEPYSGSENANAVVYVGAPSAIQYPDNSDPVKYFDTAANYGSGSDYIINSFSTIQNGTVYSDWVPADNLDFDKIVDFVYDSASQYLFGTVYKKGLYVTRSGAFRYFVYDTDTMFDGVYYGNIFPESSYTNKFSLFPIRKEYVTLQRNESIDLREVSLLGTPPEALGSQDDSLNYTSSVQNINTESLSTSVPTISSFNTTSVAAKNGVASITISGPQMGSVVGTYADKKASLPSPWNNLTGDTYAVFYLKLDYYGNSRADYFQQQYDALTILPAGFFSDDGFYDTSTFTGDYGLIQPLEPDNSDFYLCYSKVKEVVNADVNNTSEASPKFVDDTGTTFPRSVVIELGSEGVLGARVCYKFEFDFTIFKYSRLLTSLQADLGYNKFFQDKAVPLVISGEYNTVTINDIHIDTASGDNIPRSNWWMKFKIGMIRFVSDSFLPSDLIVTPENLQNLYVPLFPSSNAVYPNKGGRFSSYSYSFSINDYLDKVRVSKLPNDSDISKTSAPVFVEYRYDSLSDLNDSTIHSSGDYAFVQFSGDYPNSFSNNLDTGLYLYDGSTWSKQSFSNGQYVNYSGNLYIYVSSADTYSRFTDSDIFVSN